MPAINFGVGTVIGRRTDISNPTPLFFGILQDITIEVDQTLKRLVGQYKMPVDIAPSELKITGKAKQARIQANLFNDLILGGTLTTASGIAMATAEAHSVPGSSTYTITATQAATFKEDLGVFYASNGVQLTRVTSGSEAIGKYSVNEATGVYTFAAADASAAVIIYYTYGVTTKNQISLSNQLMGSGPVFEISLQEQYTSNAGITSTTFMKLNACRSSKLSMPFKNTDYTITEIDFEAFADQASNIGTWAFSE